MILDEAGRLKSETYSDTTPAVAFGYDQTSYNGFAVANGMGMLGYMTDGSGLSVYSYDQVGRPTGIKHVINGVAESAGYSYNVDGTLNTLTYFDGGQVQYGYNAVSQPISAYDSTAMIASLATYSPAGQLSAFNQGSGNFAVKNRTTFNNRLQPLEILAVVQAQSVLDLAYAYPGSANNGNMSQITNKLDGTRTQNFVYDQLNRLSQAKTSAWGDNYVYDSWGNLLQKNPVSGLAGESMTFTANTLNQLQGTMKYDKNGSMTTDDAGVTYTYDAEGRVTGSTYGSKTSYAYDGPGARVKRSGAVNRLYWYGAYGEVLDETDLIGNFQEQNVFLNGRLTARRESLAASTIRYWIILAQRGLL